MPLFESPTGMSGAAYKAFWMLDTVWQLRGMGLERYSLPVTKGIPTSERTWKPPSKICGTRRGSSCRSAARSKRSSYPPGRGQSDFAVVAGTAGEGV